MKTITLDILDEEAIKLLKNLELLKLIRFRNNKAYKKLVEKGQISLSDFSFAKSREILNDYKGSLSETTEEERRSEI